MKYQYVEKEIFLYILLLSIHFLCSCDQNQRLPILSEDAVILAFGDSLTYGTGAKSSESYPVILEQLAKRKVINAGVPGELSTQGLERLPDVINKHHPDLLILCHAGNDILQRKDLNRAANNIREMLTIAHQQNIPAILLGVPEFGIFLKTADLYQKIADELEIVFVKNIITDILSDQSLKSDSAHPNAKGYKMMAEQLAGILKETGAL